jgi:hypothetical protein
MSETLIKTDRVVVSADTVAEVRADVVSGNRSLFSKKAFRKNEVIADFFWDKIYSSPTYLTIQIGDDQHIELIPSWLQFTNHSCDPNAFFDTTNKQLVCIKPIRKGDEITFFYPSSEWDMDRPFGCHCKSSMCRGRISGAKHLTKQVQDRYRFTDYIQAKINSKGL